MCMLNDTDDDDSDNFMCDSTEELEQPTNFESSNSAEDCVEQAEVCIKTNSIYT